MALCRVCPRLWRACSASLSLHSSLLSSAVRLQSSVSITPAPAQPLVPRTSLSQPPWADAPSPVSLEEEQAQHAAVVTAVNSIISGQDFGRLFAVVHFAGRQWKVTDEDLILVENHIEAECGDRIRLEKVLMVGAHDFTLVGRPLLTKDLVCVEATVIEKTESRPKVHMMFLRRKRFQRKKIIVQPQTVLRINNIRLAPMLT
ncbi:39S ribosomal protein L21, mitochondrial [Boleophthalmus pectinirostris]|uniref:39S ribosomal protein L21, mitochondrial n=1 Tax=Boleophthalmus pectinirostris TaxID=150288 RepID=UPI000A1C40CE|nr:39S ribosomal protein L21, mitochondrial [Boleophthalmus pectinirostris]